jgi:hypothetical protein
MMEEDAALGHTVQRVGRLIRQRRALFYGLRGLTWGLAVAVLPVLLRAFIGPQAVPAAAGVAAAGLLAGILYGVCLRVPASDAARLTDRALGLHDRLATALELIRRADRSSLGLAAVRDASRHAMDLQLSRVVPWRWPREGRLLPVVGVALAALAYLPPVPVPEAIVPPLRTAQEAEPQPTKGGEPQALERRAPRKAETAERVQREEKEYAQRQNPTNEQAKGDLAAVFKDTNVAQKRPDFSSFLKQGDDRLRLLERTDSLPDLQRDFTQTPYKVMFRKSRSLMAGIDPRQLSPEKLRQLLEEMNRMGRRGGQGGGEGDWSQEMLEGSEALEQGQMSRALDAMERALSKMRAMEDRDRSGRGLDGGRDRGGRGRDQGRGGAGEGEGDFGEGEGSLPGKGTNPLWRGDPTDRLGRTPLDLGVEGQLRKGRREAYDTNMIGRGAQNPSRLPYMSVFSQYRKLMEDALAKENIPLDYRTQVKEYFQSLEDR